MIDANDPKLTAYVLGELNEADRAEIETQLAESAELREAVEQIRQTTALVSASLQSEPSPALTAEQRAAIQSQSKQPADKPVVAPASAADFPQPDSRRRAVSIVVAASLLFVLLAIGAVWKIAEQMDANSNNVTLRSPDGDSSGDIDKDKGVTLAAPDYLNDDVQFAPSDPQSWDETSPDGTTVRFSDIMDPESRPTADLDLEYEELIREQEATRVSRERLVESPRPDSFDSGGEVPSTAAPVDNVTSSTESDPFDAPDVRSPISATPEATPAPGTASPGDPASDTTAVRGRDGASASGERGQGQGGEGQGRESITNSTTPDRPKTWKRVKAIPNTSRLMVGDHDELPMEGLQVNVVVDGFRARVLLDCYFYNNHARQLEGNFKLRLPDDASLYYFAFGETSFEYRPMVDQLVSNGFLPADVVRASGTGPAEIMQARRDSFGNVKEARIVPKEKAAHAYSETVRRRVDPALVEWSGAGVFNARVFPLLSNKLHRVVIGYDVNLQQDGDDLVYKLDLPDHVEQRMVDLNVAALPGGSVEVTPQVKPFTSAGRAYYNFNNPHDNTLEVRVKDAGTMMLTGADGQTGEYFATRITPELPAEVAESGSDHAIFLIDTSLSSNPDKFNVWLNMLETTLAKNRDSIKQFAVLFFNIESHWWKSEYVENTEDNVRQLLANCNTLALEGATDLRQALAEATSPSWPVDSELPRPDLFLLSDGAVTWGEMNLHLLAKTLKSGTGGTLFAYKTGLTGTAVGVLEHLARESGGAVFSIVGEDEINVAATAHRNRPWELLEATVSGSSDLLTAGRIRSIYPGQSLLLVGRGQPGDEVQLKLRRGKEEKSLAIRLDRAVSSELTARLYGQVAVGQLEDFADATQNVSEAYARHFRVTGQTCSLLMLETEQDYERFNIRPKDDILLVKTSTAADIITRTIDELGDQLEDPKAQLEAWLAKLQQLPGFEFTMPDALGLAIKRMPPEAFDVTIPRITVKERGREGFSKKYFEELQARQLDYVVVNEEAARRFSEFGAADALKALSNLIENNPGDPVLAQDVAFSAIEWGMGGQAYPLLQRVVNARPYQPQVYQAMAHCLADLGHADMAMILYEIAVSARWHDRYQDVAQIVGVEYLHLLRKIDAGELTSSVPQYAKGRLESLSDKLGIGNPDLIVTMMWNTDRTDVDLHVLEPSGQECYYKNPEIRGGGKITRDVTEGFGPEMYLLPRGEHGNYSVMANFYGDDANRTTARTKVYVTIYNEFGTKRETVSRKTVLLNHGKEKRELLKVLVEK